MLIFLSLPGLLHGQTLEHRYSFISDASDSVGSANGTIEPPNGGSPATINSGLYLPGNAGGGSGVSGYVSLPNAIVLGDTSVTIECWVTQNAPITAAAIWDFGTADTSYNFGLIPASSGTNMIATFLSSATGEIDMAAPALPTGPEEYIVVTYSAPTSTANLYLNGVLDGATNFPSAGSPGNYGGTTGTTDNALGNDIYGDPQFDGVIYEFRIWNGAVSSLYLAASTLAGPSTVVSNLTPLSLSVLVTNTTMTAGQTQQVTVTADLEQVSGVPATGSSTNWTSSNPNIIAVNSSGLITAQGAGVATVSATVNGTTGTSPLISVSGAITNASLVYQGLTNTSLGHSSLYVTNLGSGGQDGLALYVTNLGSSGQDGVSMGIPANLTGLNVQFQNVDLNNVLPVGAYLQGGLVGTAGLVTNGLMGTLTLTKMGTSNYQMAVDFEPMGVTNITVMAYLQGALVYEQTNVPDTYLATIIGSMPTGMGSINNGVSDGMEVDFGSAVDFQPGTGLNITCDTIIADYVPGTPPVFNPHTFSLQLTASQVPSLTIDSENVGFVYQGLTNTSLGHSSLYVTNLGSGGQDGLALYVTNLGSSGQDGVSMGIPANLTGLNVQFQNVDLNNVLPVGAYLQGGLVGTAGLVTNGLMGTLTLTKMGTSNYQMAVDFEPMGVTNITVMAYLQGALVYEQTNVPDTYLATIIGSMPTGMGSINNGVSDGMEVDFGSAVDFQPGTGLNITCDTIIADYVPGTPPVFNPHTFSLQLTASQVPSLTIDSENVGFVYQGLTNTSLGHSSLYVTNLGSGGQDGLALYVTNLGSSGQDGVSMGIPANLTGLNVQFQNVDLNNVLPVGAYLQGGLVGTAGLVTNGLMGTLTLTKMGTSNYQMAVDFEPMGVTNITVMAYLQGALVYEQTNVPDTYLATIIGSMPTGMGSINNGVSDGMEVDFGSAVDFQPGTGLNITCDTIIADYVPGTPPVFNPHTFSLQLTASQVPSLTLTKVAVSPLLVSLISIQKTLTLQWYGAGILQQSASLTGTNWSTISGAASPYTVPIGAGSQFFRVSQPSP